MRSVPPREILREQFLKPLGLTANACHGPLGGRAFLIQRLAFGTVDEAVENQRTIPDASESAGATHR